MPLTSSLPWSDSGAVYSWGAKAYGATGTNSGSDEWTPKVLGGLTDVVTTACGTNHCLVATSKTPALAVARRHQLDPLALPSVFLAAPSNLLPFTSR